ncbi:MAG: GTPase HflX [Parachlamydiales bacterium]|nr:GTPase HflX [Parachlamydiales bacterium]
MNKNIAPLEVGRLSDLKENIRALLVGVYRKSDEKELCLEHLEELQSLGVTYGIDAFFKSASPLRKYVPATFLGKGKIEELLSICQENNVNLVIFDEEISPNQQRNLEKLFKRPVIDRTELILGVFAQHAKTKEAKIQVDLALYHYELPRLKRMWTHLSRQRTGGGKGGYLKGAGERQIEIDRRLVRDRIVFLEKELDKVKKQRDAQRKSRERNHIPTFAIIGYTNVGKSTLLNALTHAGVLVEDKLFATLDTTTRKFVLPNKQEILLIDTVGFIRKIPHTLVAAFKSTLEEALKTDVLIHLIDSSSEDPLQQAASTMEVLQELHAEKKPMITCLNKIDQCHDKSLIMRCKLQTSKVVEISALYKQGFDTLMEYMMEEVSKLRKVITVRIPQSHYKLLSTLMTEGRVIHTEYEGNDVILKVEIPCSLEKQALPYRN